MLDILSPGGPDAVRELRQDVTAAARSDVNVLIAGGAGAAGELLARVVHRRSRRGSTPFVAVACAAVTEIQLEGRLFGDAHGADETPTALDDADGGTLFLDSVSELTSHTQARLMRFLDRAEVPAAGARHSRPVDVRVICSMRATLMGAIRAGAFREDLYYRLNLVYLEVPPLTEEDWRELSA